MAKKYTTHLKVFPVLAAVKCIYFPVFPASVDTLDKYLELQKTSKLGKKDVIWLDRNSLAYFSQTPRFLQGYANALAKIKKSDFENPK